MSPLVKSLLKTKAKVSTSNTERLQHLNRRISQLISENRTHLLANPIGSQKWWKEVDSRSQRRTVAGSVALDSERLEQLNDYFGSLCTDDSYIEPRPVTIDDSVQVPEISELQVWQSLCKLKRTAVGPDNIPFWFWKDLADIFTPVVTKVWNLCLLTQSWPRSWKRANVYPLPKAELPIEDKDYRGNSITPAIYRGTESLLNLSCTGIAEIMRLIPVQA